MLCFTLLILVLNATAARDTASQAGPNIQEIVQERMVMASLEHIRGNVTNWKLRLSVKCRTADSALFAELSYHRLETKEYIVRSKQVQVKPCSVIWSEVLSG